MLRVIASLGAIPFLLVVLLAVAMDMHGGTLGSLTVEMFELGLLPVVIVAALAMLLIFLPLLVLISRFTRISWWNAAAIGFLSALLPVLLSAWPVLIDTKLRMGFRVQRLADAYPWLAMGTVGGLLFWLIAIFRNRALQRHCKQS